MSNGIMNIYFWFGMACGALAMFVFIAVLCCCVAGNKKQDHIDRNKE